jgi:hypothetical protein
MFIVFWAIVFTSLSLTSGLVFGYTGVVLRIHYATGKSELTRAGIALFVLFFGIPLLGLILGIFGKLPGTKRVKEGERTC